ncbi:MAG: hypothetical protein Q9167_004637, partial [Letrouitia subvulpina]
HLVTTNDKQRFALLPLPSSSSTAEQQSSSNPSHYLIRATQGHSLPLASANLLTPLDPRSATCPAEVVHGTRLETWQTIAKSGGLKRMGRGHVHFATGLPGGSSRQQEERANGGEKEEFVAVETLDIASPRRGKGGQEENEKGEEVKEEEEVISGMRSTATALVWVDLRRSAQEGGLQWWRSENGVVLTEGDERGMVGLEWIVRVEKRGTGEVIWRPSPSDEKEKKKKEKGT